MTTTRFGVVAIAGTTASAGISETAGAAEPFTGPKTGTGTAPSESVHPASIKTKLNRNIVRNG
jgi:hypothetical protein